MTFLFFIVAAITIVSALAVVTFKNPIHSALALVLNLLMNAAFFAMLEAHFLAAVQVVVYAGAIMVLVLFMLMLLNVKVERRSWPELAFTISGLSIGLVFLAALLPSINDSFRVFPELSQELIGSVSLMGRYIFGPYAFLFQVSGVLLMVAIVGAMMLARGKPNKGERL